jgi:hypothetical protein
MLAGKLRIFTPLLFHSTFTHLSRDLELERRKLLISLYLYSPLLTPLCLFSIEKQFPKLDVTGFHQSLWVPPKADLDDETR